MRVLRLLADLFWRVDAFLGGDVKPHRGQRFAAAHPLRLGLIVGSAFGGLFGVIVLISAALGAEYAFTLSSLLVCLGGAVFMGVFFVGVGYFGRWQQRHYGYYPAQDEHAGNS
ncbi:hypothetical protein [Nonomuraea sediminis]|uniref:hypothetical protein n=1 Tax=Nonomuraea sediminis TaxID=2835864 RepID=UPI001BDBEF05|nr:hypothetical protein [Nonomuraea sediminis]